MSENYEVVVVKMRNILKINICGFVFRVSAECLNRYPKTLLGDPDKRRAYYSEKHGEYFFNRHRLAFEGILQYYQNFGRIICPENVPDEVFHAELEFFMIECDALKHKTEVRRKVLEAHSELAIGHNLKVRVWRIMNSPHSSKGAQILSLCSLLVTCTSITIVCIYPGGGDDQDDRKDFKLFPFEMCCFLWFTCEYLARLCSCPSKARFFRSWIDLTDLVTLVIFYTSLLLTTSQASSTSVLRIFRLANVFRVFRLTRFSNGLRLLLYTIYTSRTDLQLLSGFMGFYIIISGSTVYFVESIYPGSQFDKGGVFDGIWFSLVSCTTVGYGDIVPVSVAGKCVTSVMIIFGAMFILLPVLKLVTTFSDALDATRRNLTGYSSDETA